MTAKQNKGSIAPDGSIYITLTDGSGNLATTGGGSSTLDTLTDVNVTEGAGINGYSLTYDNATSKWVATSVSGSGINNVVEDTTPQLGGDLDMNGHGISVPASTTITYSGASGPTNSWMWIPETSTISGSASSASPTGTTAPFQIMANDNVDTSLGDGELSLFSATLAPAANYVGTRNAVKGYIEVVGTPASGSPNAVGVLGLARINANQGGSLTPAAITDYKGQVYGSNSNVFAQSGATSLLHVAGHEYDVELQSGATAARKNGVLIAKGSADAVRGVYTDSALNIADQDNAGSWKNAIEIGCDSAKWPLSTDSTVLTVTPRTTGGTESATFQYGVDLSAGTITSGGAPFVAPLTTPASGTATGKAGSFEYDANNIYVATATNTWKTAPLNNFGEQPTAIDTPGYISGMYYSANHPYDFTGTCAMIANTILWVFFVNRQTQTWTELGTRIVTNVAAKNVDLAIYANDPATGLPTGSALGSTGSLSAATAGPVTGTVSVKMTPGLYWMGINCDDSTVTTTAVADLSRFMIYGRSTDNGVDAFPYTGQTFGTWPTNPTFSRTGSYALPHIWVRF